MDLLIYCFIQGARLIQGKKLVQVVDQNQAVVEPDDALELLEAGRNLGRADDFVLRALDHTLSLINHQYYRARGGLTPNRCRKPSTGRTWPSTSTAPSTMGGAFGKKVTSTARTMRSTAASD